MRTRWPGAGRLEQLRAAMPGRTRRCSRLLEGEPGPGEAVLLNAGVALVVEGGRAISPKGALARASIESGAAAGCFRG
jgi:anthranilate phosphoribosyltransferase